MDPKITEFFKKCIRKHQGQGRPTRASNIVGHLAKRPEMREWFYNRYQTPVDWINFFHEHQRHFVYDESTGNFRVRTSETQQNDKIQPQIHT